MAKRKVDICRESHFVIFLYCLPDLDAMHFSNAKFVMSKIKFIFSTGDDIQMVFCHSNMISRSTLARRAK